MAVEASVDTEPGGTTAGRERDGRGALWAIGAIAFVAVIGRILYVLVVTQHLELPGDPSVTGAVRSYDEMYYVNGARSLVDGTGFRYPFFGDAEERAEHPPLTSLALAPVAAVTDDLLPMRLVVAVVGGGVVLLVGLAGRRVGGDRVGVLAAGLAAVYPNLWMNDGLLLSESFAALGVAGAVLAAFEVHRRPGLATGAALGLACAVAMLSRSELALLVPFIALPAAVLATGPSRRRWLAAGAVVVTAGAIVAPWVAINLQRFEEPVLLSLADGDALIGANCDATYHGAHLGSHHGECSGAPLLDEELSVRSSIRREMALDYASDHLDRLPVVVLARIGRMWNVYEPFEDVRRTATEGRPRWAAYTGLAMYWALLPAAAAGLVTLRRRPAPLAVFAGILVLVTLHAALFFGFVRHRVAAEVALVLLAAIGIDALLRMRQRRADQ